MRRAVAFLFLVACGGSPAETAEATPTQPCSVAEGRWTLQVPVPPNHALAAMDGACLLIDERREATFASIATIAANAEGAELLDEDSDGFFQASGLLGTDARPVGRGAMEVLGEQVPSRRWAAQPEGLPTREITTVALRRGNDWLIVMLLATPGNAEEREHLEALLAGIVRE